MIERSAEFVTADDHALVFPALDRTKRTDTWYSNEQELWAGTDMRDPDTDDDGLTDGQEVKWLTTVQEFESPAGPGPSVDRFVVDRGQRIGTNPNEADDDGDGYWDGWIGGHARRSGDARRRRKPSCLRAPPTR